MKIGNREIGSGHAPFIIAEIGANHNGEMNLAKALIDKAVEAGADCVKFQSWSKQSIFSKIVYEQNYFLGDDYRNRTDFTLAQIVEKYALKPEQLVELKSYCDTKKVIFSSSPFSKPEVDLLADTLDVDFIKIASMDCTNFPFLEYVAKKKKPIILSTGFATMSELTKAVETIEAAGQREICILHCVSNYPPKDYNVNLNNIQTIQSLFPDHPVGFSDHSLGTCIPLAAIAKGAAVVEKHFTLDKNMFGWDHKISADFSELKTLVDDAKRVTAALGSHRRKLTSDDHERIPAFRRSIVTAKSVKKGEKITWEHLDFKRPGSGLAPEMAAWIVNSEAKRDIAADELLKREDF